jgi:hypothetical protein
MSSVRAARRALAQTTASGDSSASKEAFGIGQEDPCNVPCARNLLDKVEGTARYSCCQAPFPPRGRSPIPQDDGDSCHQKSISISTSSEVEGHVPGRIVFAARRGSRARPSPPHTDTLVPSMYGWLAKLDRLCATG